MALCINWWDLNINKQHFQFNPCANIIAVKNAISENVKQFYMEDFADMMKTVPHSLLL